MRRTWTWIDARSEELADAAVAEQCGILMKQWNDLEDERCMVSRQEFCDENEDIIREWADEVAAERGFAEGTKEYNDFVDAYVDNELNSYEERVKASTSRQRVIETMLAAVGARLARPYEHWNEEERMMQYLEEDRWL